MLNSPRCTQKRVYALRDESIVQDFRCRDVHITGFECVFKISIETMFRLLVSAEKLQPHMLTSEALLGVLGIRDNWANYLWDKG